MAGKACVFASRALAYALDGYSKNALIDLVVDLSRGELGETATDEEVMMWVDSKMTPTRNYRQDKVAHLSKRFKIFQDQESKYKLSRAEMDSKFGR
jgi:hypothetical protein